MDEVKKRRQDARGKKAAAILENELFTEAFALLDASLIKLIRISDGNEQDVRENAYLMMGLLESMKDHLKRIMTTGKVAEADLKQSLQPKVNNNV